MKGLTYYMSILLDILKKTLEQFDEPVGAILKTANFYIKSL